MNSIRNSLVATRSPMKKTIYVALAVAASVTVISFNGNSQPAQAAPTPSLVCDVTGSVKYNPVIKATDSVTTLHKEEGTFTLQLCQGDLTDEGLRRISSGKGTLKSDKIGNCAVIDVQNGTASINWEDAAGKVIGTSKIKYTAKGNIKDTVITLAEFTAGTGVGLKLIGHKLENNSINSNDPTKAETECLSAAGVKTQDGKAQFVAHG